MLLHEGSFKYVVIITTDANPIPHLKLHIHLRQLAYLILE